MRDLNYQLKKLCRQSRHGSIGTQVQRERALTLIANQLHELGYRSMNATSLKPKHIEALVKHWKETDVAIGTLKNRMSAIRWWARGIKKQNVVARSNAHYGIPNRQFVTNQSKAKDLSDEQLLKVTDPHVRMSLELQRAFGLRREEALKLQPALAIEGDRLCLKASWTKGGRAREIPIRTDAQREVLIRARMLAGRGSLIPSTRNYRHQVRLYEGQCFRAGLSQMHGLRHTYAQQRYEELTGWKSPAAGGRTTAALSAEQRRQDQAARNIISHELGHGREQITAIYLGR